MQSFIILSAAVIATYLFTLLPGLRNLRRSFTINSSRTLFLLVIFISLSLGSAQGVDLSSNLPDPTRLTRVIVLVSLALVALFSLLQQLGVAATRAGVGVQWMALYAILAMSSAIWSIGPALSLWKGFEVLALTIVAAAIAVRLRTLEDLEWLHRLTTLIFIFLCSTVLMGLAIFPADAIKDTSGYETTSEAYRAVRGLAPVLNPATVGTMGALLSVMMVANLLRRDSSTRTARSGFWVLFGVGVLVILLSRSRTSIFAGTAGILLLLIYARYWRLLIATIVLGTTLLMMASVEEIVLKFIYRGQTAEAFTGLTGRLWAWEMIWEQFLNSPMIGHGYYAAQRLLFDISSVDNTYLEVLIGLGFIGLGVFLVPLLWASFRLFASRPRGGKINFWVYLWLNTAGMFAVLVIRSLPGASFQTLHPLLVIYLIVLISIPTLLKGRTANVAQSESRNVLKGSAQEIHAPRKPVGAFARRDTRALAARHTPFSKK